MRTACPICGCDVAAGGRAHAVQAALREDDLDAAIACGLLDADVDCPACGDPCRQALRAAGNERRSALAARERFLTRQARLAQRRQERTARNKAAVAPAGAGGSVTALPAAAAAALARAKARAAGHKQ